MNEIGSPDKQSPSASDNYRDLFKSGEYAMSYHSMFNPSGWQDLADPKRLIGWIVGRMEVAMVRRMLRRGKSGRVLDIPCGSGKVSLRICREHEIVIAIDASMEMLKLMAEHDQDNVHLILADIRHIPLKDNSVDIVICNRFLHRIPEVDRSWSLREMARTTTKSLVLYFSLHTVLTEIISRIEKGFQLGDRGKIFGQSRASIIQELSKNGLTPSKTSHVLPFLSSGLVVRAEKKRFI